MQVDLDDTTVIVTGSGRGIGRAIALRFAENGANVVVNCRTATEGKKVADEISALGRNALFVEADVSDSKQIKKMTLQTVREFGGVDVLVNNAGINVIGEGRVPIQDFRESDWDRVLNVDLKGVFLCSKIVAKHMIRQKKGNIINIGSVAGMVPLRLQSAYVAAKAGVLNLTRAMALELAPHGIRVNAIAPGSILTDMTRPLFYSDPTKAKKILERIPLGRAGRPQDVASATLFLASDDASYITGSILVVDGGWTAGHIQYEQEKSWY